MLNSSCTGRAAWITRGNIVVPVAALGLGGRAEFGEVAVFDSVCVCCSCVEVLVNTIS